MAFKKFVLCCFAGVQLFAIFYAYISYSSLPGNHATGSDPEPCLTEPPLNLQDRSYKFVNISLANRILKQLDIYQNISEAELKNKYNSLKFKGIYHGLRPDDEYCDKHRIYFIEHPESILNEMKVLIARSSHSFIAEDVVLPIGKIVNIEISSLPASMRSSPVLKIELSTTCFFTSDRLHSNLHLGKRFSCLSQESNHIPDSSIISQKNQVVGAVAEYLKLFEGRPQCLSQNKYFPRSWMLNNKEQCQDFFSALNSPEYKRLQEERRIVYIRKEIGKHKGEGVFPVNEEQEAYIRNEYANGKLCGKNRKRELVQHYIHNSLLVNGHKFDFRIYMLIA